MTRQSSRSRWLIRASDVRVDQWFTFGLAVILSVSWIVAKV